MPNLAEPIAISHAVRRPAKLVPAIVESVVDRITSNEFVPGDLLPKESALVEQFGVSRTVIRESLRVVEEKGLISIQQGRGTEVNPVERWNLLDPLVIAAQVRHDPTLDTLDQMIVVRAAMESEMARTAAERMSKAWSERLQTALDKLARSTASVHDYIVADREFHDLIMKCSGNMFGRRIAQEVHEWALTPETATTLDHLQEAERDHREMFVMLTTGNAAGAAEVTRRHIVESWRRTRPQIARLRAEAQTDAISSSTDSDA